jgi:hypothetical protein
MGRTQHKGTPLPAADQALVSKVRGFAQGCGDAQLVRQVRLRGQALARLAEAITWPNRSKLWVVKFFWHFFFLISVIGMNRLNRFQTGINRMGYIHRPRSRRNSGITTSASRLKPAYWGCSYWQHRLGIFQHAGNSAPPGRLWRHQPGDRQVHLPDHLRAGPPPVRPRSPPDGWQPAPYPTARRQRSCDGIMATVRRWRTAR